ncbi:Flp pilus assembly protein CpaB [Falsigemmobacter faecalis]|uniref:Flp pilus assembly protein RcpC/CpaB domain-containing protein n=1 Tax=Falsigemmobacter faecalis TaxID=2488730 RepID=A0A3P3DRL7_9RHOB|nr:RcpC/CpaB family pilus assembly protein [Falsigemmobacter faecalis]RRH76903.1 hypothetical protein EG244_04655 [Falsigemmobacter faecalis]
MRFRIFALLIMGVALALVAGFASFSYTRGLETRLSTAEAALSAYGETLAVPVPARDIPRGDVLSRADFLTLQVPARHLPANLLTAVPEAGPEGKIIALSDLSAGGLVAQAQVGVASGPNHHFALSPGGRAVRVVTENFADFESKLVPGAQMDLFWTRQLGGGSTETRLIGHALRVLAIDSTPAADRKSRAIGAVTLEAGLEDAARLLEAQGGGRFHILPLGRLEVLAGAPPVVAITAEDLAALPLAVRRAEATAASLNGSAASAVPLRGCHTSVVRGAARSIVEVPC